MNERLNIDQVARIAGVSTATVSRVINDYPFVKEQTRKKVLKVIGDTKYRVNAVARSLRRKRTYSIGVIVSNVLSPFYSVIAKSVEDVASKNGYSTILCNGGDNPEKELKYLHVLHENRVDGVILSPTGKNRDYLQFLISSGIPVSFVDRTVEGVECDAVVVNNREASYRAVEYLVKKGYRRIGFISGPKDRMTGFDRLEGYIRALKDNRIDVDEKLIKVGDFTIESGKRMAAELLEETDSEVIYVANHDMATGAYQVLREKGLSIPEDIGFMMFDDPDWASLVSPRITAIRQPVYTLGSTAAELLFKRILEGRKYMDIEPVQIVLEAKFLQRESV
ncbi:MAG: LacI family DNA-binding transcriptional regulator [Spirochaetota bacterium]